MSHDYNLKFKQVEFKLGQVERHFIRVPSGASFASLLMLKSNDKIHLNINYFFRYKIEDHRTR